MPRRDSLFSSLFLFFQSFMPYAIALKKNPAPSLKPWQPRLKVVK